ncbi:uncharacterized protein MELLADRAFT_73700, partial [Melampsora larici-populina 98AG31]
MFQPLTTRSIWTRTSLSIRKFKLESNLNSLYHGPSILNSPQLNFTQLSSARSGFSSLSRSWRNERTIRSFSNFSRLRSGQPQRTIIDQYRDRHRTNYKARNRSLMLYTLSLGILTLGLSYAAVPLYRVFCSVTGYNGTPLTKQEGNGKFSADRISRPIGEKSITVRFNADKSDTLNWKFWPCQKSVKVKPGETVLAFYKAKNLSDKDILGVATYNVTPGQVAPYFAKVECFCFDEQRLMAGEEVDLPIFFFIDKDFMEDPLMNDIDDIILSYTFFKARRNSMGQLEPDSPASASSST